MIELFLSRQPTNTNHQTKMKIRPATKRAITKYGIQTCVDAYKLHTEGNGAGSIRFDFAILNGNTNAADAAINAGRDIATQSAR